MFDGLELIVVATLPRILYFNTRISLKNQNFVFKIFLIIRLDRILIKSLSKTVFIK